MCAVRRGVLVVVTGDALYGFGFWGELSLTLRGLDLSFLRERKRQDATRFLEGRHEYLSGTFMLVKCRGVSVGAWWCYIGQKGKTTSQFGHG